MTTEMKGVFSLKVRSKSMPIVSIVPKSPHFQRLKKSRQKMQAQLHHQLSQNKQVLDLSIIKNQEEEQMNSKMKTIAERSMKKLEERYETIDKWKQKYVPQSSIVLLRNKLSLEHHSSKANLQDKHIPIIQIPQSPTKTQLFPMIITKQMSPTLSDQKQQGKRLQQMLRQRLQKNKKYFQLKNLIIEKQINYFQDINNFVAPEKKREIELRKLMLQSQEDGGFNRAVFYQKISLSQPIMNKQCKTHKTKWPKEQKPRYKLNHDTQMLNKKEQTDICQLKAKLMEQMSGTTPEGWNTLSPEEEDLL